MTPDEIKSRLDEADAKIAEQLAEIGFTPDEIQRQLDKSIPDDVKAAEREQVLARTFQRELDDPKSGLMDAILARAADDLDKRMPEIEAKLAAERRARRTKLVIGGIALVAAVGVGVWYFALRDTRTSCEKLVGPLDAVEKLAGMQLELGHGHEVGTTCYKYIYERGKVGQYIVHLDTSRRSGFKYKLQELERGKYTDTVKFDTAAGPAVLFVAGDATETSTEQLAADVNRRAATGRRGGDPVGEALANLPPAQHAIIFTAGDRLVQLNLDRKVWTPEAAKTYAAAVAARAK